MGDGESFLFKFFEGIWGMLNDERCRKITERIGVIYLLNVYENTHNIVCFRMAF